MTKTGPQSKLSNRVRLNAFVYGHADNHEYYAVAVVGDRAWRACEVDGLLYRPCLFDEIPEQNWDRISNLEEKVAHE